MSEATRQARAAAIEETNKQVGLKYDKIAELEDEIAALIASVPKELPEDYEWWLEQMTPRRRRYEEQMREISKISLRLAIEQTKGLFNPIQWPKDFKVKKD